MELNVAFVWPKYARGHATGWIYTLQEDKIFGQAAFYKTVQHNGTYEILFCEDNFKEEKRKGKTVPAVLYAHSEP